MGLCVYDSLRLIHLCESRSRVLRKERLSPGAMVGPGGWEGCPAKTLSERMYPFEDSVVQELRLRSRAGLNPSETRWAMRAGGVLVLQLPEVLVIENGVT